MLCPHAARVQFLVVNTIVIARYIGNRTGACSLIKEMYPQRLDPNDIADVEATSRRGLSVVNSATV